MKVEVEFTDQFHEWWLSLSENERIEISSVVGLLEEEGTSLGYPRSSKIKGSKHSHMRELRIQYAGNPYRVLYAFDPLRVALLLLGGNKAGDENWYEKIVPVADRLYDDHLAELEAENQDRSTETHG
jgi:hypothetical protein